MKIFIGKAGRDKGIYVNVHHYHNDIQKQLCPPILQIRTSVILPHTYTRIHTCIYTYIYTHTCIYKQYMNTDTHAYIHTYVEGTYNKR